MLQRIFPEGLNAVLTKGLSPFYLLTGQDLLLVNESKDSIVQAARLQQFEEKNEISLSNDTKWDNLFTLVQSNGLFSSRQILILNLPDTLPAPQQKLLADLLAYSHSDLLFILHCPKFSKAVEKQVWFARIQTGIVVNCQTPEISKLPMWVNHRAKSMALTLESEAVQFLCYSYEGNLPALKQTLQLLQLQFPDKPISLVLAKEVVAQSVQFTPFQWVDALLSGKIGRALRILNYLRHEETQAVILLRILQKELQLLLEMTRRVNQPTDSRQRLDDRNLRQEFDRLKIWQNRRTAYQAFIARATYRQLYHLIQHLADLERRVKQEFGDDIWEALERLSLAFA